MANDRDWRTIDDEREKYAAYLCSREWGVKREAVHKRARGLCERCELFLIDAVHHLTYERKYQEELEDLQGLCKQCHAFTHAKSDFDPVLNKRFIDWLGYCKDEIPPWLHHEFKLTFLSEVFSSPPMALAFNTWVAVQFVDVGQDEMVRTYGECVSPDGFRVDDLGVIPSRFQFQCTEMMDTHSKRFFSWLSWDGPTQFPVGDKGVFKQCLESVPLIKKQQKKNKYVETDF